MITLTFINNRLDSGGHWLDFIDVGTGFKHVLVLDGYCALSLRTCLFVPYNRALKLNLLLNSHGIRR